MTSDRTEDAWILGQSETASLPCGCRAEMEPVVGVLRGGARDGGEIGLWLPVVYPCEEHDRPGASEELCDLFRRMMEQEPDTHSAALLVSLLERLAR